jgi:hypothetical protein
MLLQPANEDDGEVELAGGECASLSVLLLAGFGLLWFFGWLLTL